MDKPELLKYSNLENKTKNLIFTDIIQLKRAIKVKCSYNLDNKIFKFVVLLMEPITPQKIIDFAYEYICKANIDSSFKSKII